MNAPVSGNPSVSVPPAFPDVSRGDPNLLFINYLSNRHLVTGYPDGAFHPAAGLTRAEAATLLVKVAGLQPASGPMPFSDVPAGSWAYGNIAAAAAAGLVHGYPDGAFHPGAVLTRAEGAVIFTNLIRQPNEAALPVLSDLSPGHWAARAVALALAAGMVQTSALGRFSPDDPLTRSDLARVLGVILTENPDYDQVALSGTLKPLTGTVQLAAGGATPAIVTAPIPIAEGETVTTVAGSSAEIDFPDGSSLLLKDNTVLTVKKMQGRSRLGPDGAAGTAIAWLEVGMSQGQMYGALASRYEQSGQLKPLSLHGLPGSAPSRAINLADDETGAGSSNSASWYQAGSGEEVQVQVDMPWGVAGIEGTIWHITISLQGITESTADGLVQLTSNNGQSVQVSASFQASLTGSVAAPTAPITMTSPELSDWQSVLAWVQQVATAVQNQVDPNSDTIATAIMNAVASALGSASPPPSHGGGGVSLTTKGTPGTFTPTVGNMVYGDRSYCTATLLNNGQVLIAGGEASDQPTSNAEIYDPATGQFSLTTDNQGSVTSMVYARMDHTATLLQSGKVLIAGGIDALIQATLNSSELYDPATGQFSPTTDNQGSVTGMVYARTNGQTATLLPGGQVLIAGGYANGAIISTAEIYDPSTGRFTTTGSMVDGRYGHTATLLLNGQVLIAGGRDQNGNPVATAELYDPSTGLFTDTGSMVYAWTYQTATLLPSGKVLIAGGQDQFSHTVATAELYDPDTGQFTATGSMSQGRAHFTATLLPDDTVLVAGGNSSTPDGEIYWPGS